jgi:DNA-binding NarL/FixJ family response regulator
MRVLIVEDDENKRLQVTQAVYEMLPQAVLAQEKSLQSGLRYARQCRPDLVLLDMTLPNYDAGPDESGGLTHIFGGREFLRQMDRFDLSMPVIVITQFETFGKGEDAIDLPDLDKQLREEHADLYVGVVYYHAAISGWKEELKKLIASTLPQERLEC